MSKRKATVIMINLAGVMLVALGLSMLFGLNYWLILAVTFLLVEGYECISYKG